MTTAEIARHWLKLFPKLSPNRVMAEFLPILGEAWEAKKMLFAASDMEDSITNTLAADIMQRVRQRVQQGKHISWGVYSQVAILAENDDGAEKQ